TAHAKSREWVMQNFLISLLFRIVAESHYIFGIDCLRPSGRGDLNTVALSFDAGFDGFSSGERDVGRRGAFYPGDIRPLQRHGAEVLALDRHAIAVFLDDSSA